LLEVEGKATYPEKINNEGKLSGEFETKLVLRLEGDDGKVETVEGTPRELFKRWIDSPRNFHHVQNELPPGGGTPPAGKGGSGKVNFDGMKPTDKLNKARELGIGSK
jgi:hypothetical protein